VRAQKRARPGVADGQGNHAGPVLAGDQDRVARGPVVGGDRDARAGREGGDQAPYRLRPDQRLVHERDHRRGTAVRHRGQPGGERRAHAAAPIGVVHRKHAGQVDGHRSGDYHDGRGAAVAQHGDAALRERLPADLDQRLRLPEPAALARGKQDPGDFSGFGGLHACQATTRGDGSARLGSPLAGPRGR